LNIGRLLQTYAPLPTATATTTNEQAMMPIETTPTSMTALLGAIDDGEYMTQPEIPEDGAGWHSCGDTELHSEQISHATAINYIAAAPKLARSSSSQRRQRRAARLKQVVEQAEDFRALAFSSAEVANFVKAYVRRLLPASLLGSRHNVNVMMAAVQQFITLQRHDTITLGEVR
jgi:hypothetical protein